jgi:hypothetical protein
MLACLLAGATLLCSSPLLAQVTDAERAAARELFKEGDELQRAGKFGDALDKFQRAQKVYSAPTNQLRIAQCQAAIGQLAESAESYRATLRMPVPPGSPKAFDVAVEQAKAELAQIEPRVPKLVVQVSPASSNVQMQIDGQTVSGALVGEPLPLDPGVHKVRVFAPGFASSEQDAVLKEHETTTVIANLRPTANAAPAPAQTLPSPASTAGTGTVSATGAAPPSTPPPYIPPPTAPVTDKEMALARAPSRAGLLFGGHFGWGVATGAFPFDNGQRIDASTVAGSGGLAWGLDAGFRFARHWYAGLAVEHAELGHGNLSNAPTVSDASSSTTLFGVAFGFIANPDHASFYGQIGAGTRWFSFTETANSAQRNASFNAAELMLGAGVWLPVGRSVRLLPEATLGWGAFDVAASGGGTTTQAHVFWLLGMAGYYNLDF